MDTEYFEFIFKNEPIRVHQTWKHFFETQLPLLQYIESAIGNNYTPSAQKLFTIFTLPKNKINTIIVGQDPYPQLGVATGRSFEVKATDWNQVNASLKAILQSFYYHAHGYIASFQQISEAIEKGEWDFFKPSELFEVLEKNYGVFFLNKSLTCEIGKPNSHRDVWHPFTSALAAEIAINPNITWLLWGSDAKQLEPIIGHGQRIIKALHPVAYVYSHDKTQLESFIKNSGLHLIF